MCVARRPAILREATAGDVGGKPPGKPEEGFMRSSRLALLGIGVIGVVALVALIATNVLGSPGPSPQPPIAQASAPATPDPTPTPAPSASPTASPEPTPTVVPTPATVADPLTGQQVTPDIARRHPIAVMIDDLLPARPQSGLSQADIVWQAPAEGGIPRYMAIFQTKLPKDIGPVRSSRYYYITWAAEWRAVYTHAGGSPQALQTLQAKGRGQYVWNLEAFRRPGAFRRIQTRHSPHNLYTTGPNLRRAGQNLGAKDQDFQPAWTFAPDAPLDKRPTGGSIKVVYLANTITYTYDRKTNTYLRSVTGEAKQTDASNGQRIAPKNVIVMRVKFGRLSDGHPEKGRLEADVVGSGKAWISTNGKTIVGTWKKTSVTSPTQFFDGQGRPVTLTIGQTFINVMQLTSPVSFKAGTPPAAPSPVPSPTAS
jgi:DUF3048 family protein